MNCALNDKIKRIVDENKSVFLTAFLSGIAAFMFVLSNKLVSPDELLCTFGKGSTISSGRWGLELSKILFPDYSLPWLYGLVSIILLSAAACIAVKLFRIKSRPAAAIAAAVIVTFPTEAVTLAYMFTAGPYALAMLCAVCSVYIFVNAEKYRKLYAVPLLTFGLGIYQAYLGVAAAYMIVWFIMLVLDGEENAREILLRGVKSVAFLAGSALLYYAINLISLRLFGSGAMNAYAAESLGSTGLLRRVFNAYRSFFGFFYRGHYDLVRTGFPWVLHWCCMAVTGLGLAGLFFREKNAGKRLLLILLLALLPLGINCVCLVADNLHNLMLYGFTAVYFLALVTAERSAEKLRRGGAAKTLISAGLALVLITNIFYANQLYLKMYLQFQEAKSFYTTLASGIMMTPGFCEDDEIVLIGEAKNCLYTGEDIDTEDVAGVMEGLINIYCRPSFMKYYCGFDFKYADDDTVDALFSDGAADDMPAFPYNGYIKRVDNYIIVNLGTE